MINKKLLMLIIFSVFFFFGIVLLMAPFFNTGLILTTTPSDAQVSIQGFDKKLSSPVDLKLPAGKYQVMITKDGYRKTEKLITVKNYGKTKVIIEPEKLAPLLQSLPYVAPDSSYIIRGKNDDYQEPVYYISYTTAESKEAAKTYLASMGIDDNNSIINYFDDLD